LQIQGEPPSRPSPTTRTALFALGFRPFFIAAPAFAATAMVGWLLCLAGVWSPGTGSFAASGWHAHEMIFGYAMAVVAGFLLTATRNWTGRETPSGGRLMALVGLWAAGRVAMAGVLSLPSAAIALIALLFPVSLLAALARVVIGARSRRNYGILLILTLLTLLQAGWHAAQLSGDPNAARGALAGAVHLIVLLHVVIGGRVIPMFTNNALVSRGIGGLPDLSGQTFSPFRLARAGLVASVSVAMMAPLAAAGVTALNGVLATAAGVAGVIHVVRMRGWRTLAAMRLPMVAVLHAGHLWIVAGYLLLAWFAAHQTAWASASTHAFTVGVFGTMTVGMMARVSLGHTGRPIEADRVIVASFVAMAVAAVVRVSAAALFPAELWATRTVPGVLFAASALLLLWRLAPILMAPRADGRPG
jgi:uncharacterized protein involved in response to NO